MKNLVLKSGKCLANLALLITSYNVNVTCTFMAYQPKLPKSAERLHNIK